MDRTDAIAWVLSACALYLRFSQAKTLVALVEAATRCQRVSLASLGRRMSGPTSVKHHVKRAWRFIANDRVEPTLAMSGVTRRLLRRWPKRKALLITFDWTDIRGLQTLVAAAALKGRAVPLAWASCHKHVWDGHKSRNSFEEALLLVLRHMIPRDIDMIILADRGFGRTALGRFCQTHGFRYVIRIQPKVMIRYGSVRCRLDRYPAHKGMCRLLRGVLYRDNDPLQQNVVVRWKKGLPKKRDEAWYLMTDLDQPARWLSDLYGRRMSIEQLFRDHKSKRNGWSLRDTGIKDPKRLDRLILVLALAYLLLMGVGLVAQQSYRPGAWSSNNRADAASLFVIGQCMLERIGLGRQVLIAVIRQWQSEVEKWG